MISAVRNCGLSPPRDLDFSKGGRRTSSRSTRIEAVEATDGAAQSPQEPSPGIHDTDLLDAVGHRERVLARNEFE